MRSMVRPLVVAALSLGTTVGAQSGWTPPRTADGHPDLQGYWYFGSATPLERPKEFEGKAFLTAEEAAAFEQRTDEHRGDVLAVHAPEWLDYGKHMGIDRRTSLVTDPPDGRVPALTPAARDRVAARRTRIQNGPADNPDDRPSGAWCSAPDRRCCRDRTTTTCRSCRPQARWSCSAR
jgi:hypothetical protein